MNTRIKKLFNNSIVFAIGNLGSRVVSIAMVPFYTYVLTTQEYGKVDLYLTTLSLLLPIVTLSIPDAVLRFVMDDEEDKNKVMCNSVFILSIGYSIFFILLFISSFFINFPKSIFLIIMLQGIQLFLAQYVRAIGLVKEYAYNGIFMSLILAISNVIFMYFFKLKVDGYLYSIILANFMSIVYFLKYIDVKKFFKKSEISKQNIKSILMYSIPLIPNGIMWWVLNASSRFFILSNLGVSYNGIFAVSNKIPSLLIIFQTIFFQAWQLSAIEESKSEDSSKYSSDVYFIFSKFMFLMTLVLILMSKFVIVGFVSSNFSDSWKYVPFLLLGVLYSSFSSFIGTQYLVLKKTTGIFKSSILGALANVAGCFYLIPIFGIQGASISLFIGFFMVYIFRLINITKISGFNVSIKSEVINLGFALLATQVIMIDNLVILLLSFLIILAVFFWYNNELIDIFKKCILLFKKKK